MSERLRIAVSGLAVTYPFGGVFWDYVQYPVGLARLGHDVLYLEDTGHWCYDPEAETFVEDGSRNAARFAAALGRLEPKLATSWFYRDGGGRDYGRPWPEVAAFCRDADLFIHISASCWLQEEYFSAKRVAFVDSDPIFTQAAMNPVETLRRHDVFFTFAENIGAPDCLVPADVVEWVPTRQPIVLDAFVGRNGSPYRPVFTTVASWESTEGSSVVDGVEYGGKGVEFERFIDLPARSPVTLELALAGSPPADRLRAHGWQLRDAYEVSGDPWTYLDYLRDSLGEWSVAKNAYVASRSGWFSCRSACYLALGVPAVVQDTGFGAAIPTGEGVLSFATLDEAGAAIEAVARDPRRHSQAARAIAEEYFDSEKVLSSLLEEALR